MCAEERRLSRAWSYLPRSRWVVGVSVHADYGTNGASFGSGLRLQTDFDFKRLFKSRKPDTGAAK